MSSTIAGKQTLGVASPRSASKKKSHAKAEYYNNYGGAASDNGAVISRIEKFEESKYKKNNGKKNRRINSAHRPSVGNVQ